MNAPGTTIREAPVGALVAKEVTFTGNTSVAQHAHERAQFCVLLDGACTEVIRNRERTYRASTLLFYRDDESHRFRIHKDGGRCFKIILGRPWSERMKRDSIQLDTLVTPQNGRLARLGLQAYREFRSMDGVSSVSMEGIVLEMLALSVRASRVSNHRPPWLDTVEDLIESRLTGHISVADIAEVIGRHPVHVARVFKKHLQCTIYDYVRHRRIQRACERLRQPDPPLATIALQLGFSDQSHFSRTFKEFTGMTPSQYRTAFLNE